MQDEDGLQFWLETSRGFTYYEQNEAMQTQKKGRPAMSLSARWLGMGHATPNVRCSFQHTHNVRSIAPDNCSYDISEMCKASFVVCRCRKAEHGLLASRNSAYHAATLHRSGYRALLWWSEAWTVRTEPHIVAEIVSIIGWVI